MFIEGKTDEELTQKAKKTIETIENRAKSLRLQLNSKKTQIIQINCEIEPIKIGIKQENIKNKGKFLGMKWQISTYNNKQLINLDPMKETLIKRINTQYPKIIAVKKQTKTNSQGIKIRTTMIKNFILAQLTEASIIIGYNSKIKKTDQWKPVDEISEIIKAYYKISRSALGLERTTDRQIIDQIMGIRIEKFVEVGLINIMLRKNNKIENFDRTSKIRSAESGTFMEGAKKLWNEHENRRQIIDMEIVERKKYMKNEKKIKVHDTIKEKLARKYIFKSYKTSTAAKNEGNNNNNNQQQHDC